MSHNYKFKKVEIMTC